MPESPAKLDFRSLDIAADKRRLLRQLFPEVFTESSDAQGNPAELDFEKLKAVLGEHSTLAAPGAETYGLDWPGKRDALKAVQSPALGTLLPCPEESVDWESTKNVFIEGDNLEVLKLLQKSYYGKVKMIYIDPPYNTGNDFVYPDNYAESLDTYLRFTGQISGEGIKLTTNSKDSGRFHSNWLRMMYPRLYVAKNLLREDGVIFISIDDNEVSNLRHLCDQIFGEDSFAASIAWQKTYSPANDKKGIDAMHDYILVYQKSDILKINLLPRTSKQDDAYSNPDNDPRGAWKAVDATRAEHRDYAYYPIITPNGREVYPADGRSWVFTKEDLPLLLKDNRLWFGKDGNSKPSKKLFLTEVKRGVTPTTWWSHEDAGHNDQAKKEIKLLFPDSSPFQTPKPTRLIRLACLLGSSPQSNDIVLDFFAGSATSAHAVMVLNAEDGGNRRCISIQLPENCEEKGEAFKSGYKTIAEISKERIRRAGAKIRAEWEAKAAQQVGELDLDPPSTIHDPSPPDLGFRVFKLAPSNFKRWDGGSAADSVEALEAQMEANLDHLADHATEESILFEILLKAGFDLTCPVEKRELAGHPVYAVEGGSLLLCLAERIDNALIDAVTECHPGQFICLDRALHGDDALKVNALETFRACKPEIQFRTV